MKVLLKRKKKLDADMGIYIVYAIMGMARLEVIDGNMPFNIT
jgi:hypothetical protein